MNNHNLFSFFIVLHCSDVFFWNTATLDVARYMKLFKTFLLFLGSLEVKEKKHFMCHTEIQFSLGY